MPTRTVQIEFDATMKAVLRNDDLSLSLTISMPYTEGRKVHVTIDEFTPETIEAVGAVLRTAINEAQETGLTRAQAAAAEAMSVAIRGGEL